MLSPASTGWHAACATYRTSCTSCRSAACTRAGRPRSMWMRFGASRLRDSAPRRLPPSSVSAAPACTVSRPHSMEYRGAAHRPPFWLRSLCGHGASVPASEGLWRGPALMALANLPSAPRAHIGGVALSIVVAMTLAVSRLLLGSARALADCRRLWCAHWRGVRYVSYRGPRLRCECMLHRCRCGRSRRLRLAGWLGHSSTNWVRSLDRVEQRIGRGQPSGGAEHPRRDEDEENGERFHGTRRITGRNGRVKRGRRTPRVAPLPPGAR